MFLFNFTEARAKLRVTYTAAPTPGLVAQLLAWDFSKTKIALIAPKIPVPNDMLFAMLSSALNSSAHGINTWFSDHSFRFPPNLAALLPNPELWVTPQPGCCSQWVHGFLDIEGYGGGAAPPRSVLHRGRSGSAGHEFTAVVFGGGGQPNTHCELGRPGDHSLGALVPATGGSCEYWPGPTVPGLNATYYSLAVAAGAANLTLSNSSDCTHCIVCATGVAVGACGAAVSPAGASAAVLYAATVPHPGAAVTPPNATATGTLAVYDDSRCEGSFVMGTLAPAKCAAMPGDVTGTGGYYALVPTDEGGLQGRFWCPNASCVGCQLSATAEPGRPAGCAAVVGGGSFQLWLPAQIPSFAAERTIPWATIAVAACGALAACGLGFIIWRHRSRCGAGCASAGGAMRGARRGVSQGVWAVADRAGAGWRRVKDSVPAPPRFGCGCCVGTWSALKSVPGRLAQAQARVRRWLRGTWLWNRQGAAVMELLRQNYLYGGWDMVDASEVEGVELGKNAVFLSAPRPEYHDNPMLVYRTTCGLCAVASVAATVHAVLWVMTDPMAIFTTDSLQRIGLSSDTLSSRRVTEHFDLWSHWGCVGAIANAAALTLGALLYAMGRGQYRSVVFLLTMATAVHFGTIMLPALLFKFGDGFVVKGTNGTLLKPGGELARDLEYDIGVGFTTVAISWFGSIFTYAMTAVPPAIFAAAALFWRQQLAHGGGEAPLAEGRILTMLFLTHLTVPLATLLGVILLYQGSGAAAGATVWWPITWLVLWGGPPLWIGLWTRTFPRWQDGGAESRAGGQAAYIATYTAIMGAALGALFYGEFTQLHGIDGRFLATTTATTFALLVAFAYTGLWVARPRAPAARRSPPLQAGGAVL